MPNPLYPVLALALACAGSASRPDPARTAPIDSASLVRLVDSVIPAGMRGERIPGVAFVLVQQGRILVAKGFGSPDLASGRAVDPARTLFPIASISKVFTATALMQLVDQGKVALDRDVNQYLVSAKVPATYPEPVTPWHLLTHTAGFDELRDRLVRDSADLMPLGRFLSNRLIRVRRPGELTSYSSFGMALAGLLVEDVSHQPFEQYLREHLWEPLGMTRTSIAVPASRNADRATAYEKEGDKLVPIPWEIYQTPPTSSIVSTAEDMARFMIAHLQNGKLGNARILSDSAAALMHRQRITLHPLLPGWALGFQVDDANGHRILEHGGDIGGFSSLLTLLPDQGIGFFIVNHLEGSNLRFNLRKAILDRYFPDRRSLTVPTPDPNASGRLARFAGTYRASAWCHTCPAGEGFVQDFEVTVDHDGALSIWDSRWVEVSPLYFVRADGKSRLGFAEDRTGRVFGLTRGSWRVLERVK